MGLSLIVIPVHVHIVTNADMIVDGKLLDMWVDRDHICDVAAFVNAIWAPAGIQFDITSSYEFVLNDASRIAAISNSSRQDKDQTNRNMLSLVKTHVPRSINVYLFPFIGSTRQGVAPSPKKFPHPLTKNHSTIFMGVWSDKFSKEIKRVLLETPMPVQDGSISRTMAHEIGHVLGLNHPITSDLPRLMGGPIDGYHLTTDEIAIARVARVF